MPARPKELSLVLFTQTTLAGLTEGRVSCTYRRWKVVRPKVGSRFTTSAGLVEVTSIDLVPESELTEHDARSAGFEGLSALSKWTSGKGDGDLYRIGIALAGPDPRIALRAADRLSDAELVDLHTKLDRMDRAADQPWTRPTLELIRLRPAVVSTELATELDQPRPIFKLRVRRLKALGLTESLQVGYRLSARGLAYLTAARP
jgi:hypothetical protein